MNLNNKTTEELLAMIQAIENDPVNQMPKDKNSIYLYTPVARKQLDKLSMAVANNQAEKRRLAGNPVVADGYSGRQSNRR
jgi:ribonuclease D